MISIRPRPGRANSAEYELSLILISSISERGMFNSVLGSPSTMTEGPPEPLDAGSSNRESEPITSRSSIGRPSNWRGSRRTTSAFSLAATLRRASESSTFIDASTSAIDSAIRNGLDFPMPTSSRVRCTLNPGCPTRSS